LRRIDVNAELALRLRPAGYIVGDMAPPCRPVEIPFPYVGFFASVQPDKVTTLDLHIRCAATP